MTDEHEYRSLAILPNALTAHCGRSEKYRRLITAACDGLIPVIRHRNRWYFQDEDVPRIATALGLTADQPASPASDPINA